MKKSMVQVITRVKTQKKLKIIQGGIYLLKLTMTKLSGEMENLIKIVGIVCLINEQAWVTVFRKDFGGICGFHVVCVFGGS